MPELDVETLTWAQAIAVVHLLKAADGDMAALNSVYKQLEDSGASVVSSNIPVAGKDESAATVDWVDPEPADRHAVTVYLASLTESTRKTVEHSLIVLAGKGRPLENRRIAGQAPLCRKFEADALEQASIPRFIRNGMHRRAGERLAVIKKKYDPSNLFRVNQNIKPS